MILKPGILFAIGCVLLAGCTAIGPPRLSQDRFNYNTAVSDSWKEQSLLNIVKLRYADMPLFMEVASIVSGYSLESAVNMTGTIIEGGENPGTLSLGGSGKFTDRPTITYAPITGSQFNKNYLTPIPPSALLFLIQAGWPADVFLSITLEAINGLRAQKSAGASQRSGNDQFYRVIELFGIIQRAGALGMRVIAGDNSDETTVLVIRRKNMPTEITQATAELTDLLGLRIDANEYQVAYAEVAKNDTELAILTRSTLTIMLELAGQIRVPEQHIAEGRTPPSRFDGDDKMHQQNRRLIDIRHSIKRPKDAFVSVKYSDHWFWIDDRDFKSKRTFAYLMLIFSLTESGGREGLPLVTIPAG